MGAKEELFRDAKEELFRDAKEELLRVKASTPTSGVKTRRCECAAVNSRYLNLLAGAPPHSPTTSSLAITSPVATWREWLASTAPSS